MTKETFKRGDRIKTEGDPGEWHAGTVKAVNTANGVKVLLVKYDEWVHTRMIPAKLARRAD